MATVFDMMTDKELDEYIKLQHTYARKFVGKTDLTFEEENWVNYYLFRARMALNELERRMKNGL